MDKLSDIYYDYISIEYDLRCVLQALEIFESHYSDNDMPESKNTLHLIKNLLRSGQKELWKNNLKLDVLLLEQ